MRREDDLGRWLKTVEAGRPACVFADDVEDTRNALEQLVTSEREPARVVALTWADVPTLGNELGMLVSALARATLDSFPSLYGLRQAVRERWTESDVEAASHEVARLVPGVLRAACRQILLACVGGDLPTVRRLSNSELVHQLALAIEPHRLVVLITVLNATSHGVRLRALAQGAEWLAANAHSRVVLVLPEALHATPDLDRVTYAACLYAGDRANADVGNAPAPEQPTRVSASTPRKGNEEAAVFVSAVRGAPHPASDAELILHRLITADAELRPLFSYNQPVTTRYETTPTVDLVWEAGRLVIEIDGEDHRRCGKFAQDRLRDFHLLMSGYHVIRFTSSRVLEQSDMVVDWIRDAVRYLGKTEK